VKAPLLLSNRLELRPLNLSFCTQQYVDWMNDPEVYKYLETRGHYTIGKLREYLSDVEEKNILFWAIVLRGSDKHIGNIKIDPILSVHGLGEYGIMMGEKSEWGKGYAFEASKIVIDFCFETLGIRKLNLGVVEENNTAVNLYKKLGFVTEGLHKNHLLYDSQYHNSLRMALFNPKYTY
jgi:[ribosomal protein S5]-alanine N-acetyltransferase